jgi:iron(III) transport system ATP-binding protein
MVNAAGLNARPQPQAAAVLPETPAKEPMVSVFDELLSNLDAKVRERRRDELLAMQQRFGFTAIYVTHDQVEAAALANRIAVMEVGAVAQLGSPIEVFNSPASRYVADFVGCTNELAGTVTSGAERGQLQVDTPIGPLLGTSASPGMSPGQHVRVMFRPENGRFAENGSTGPNRYNAKVEQIIFLGSHVEYRLNVGGARVLVRSMEDEPLHTESDVTIFIDPQNARVFAGE